MRKVSVCVLSVSSPATSHDDSSEDEATVVNYDEDGPILQHTKFPGYTSKNHSTPYQVLLLVGGCCESMTFAASNLSAPVCLVAMHARYLPHRKTKQGGLSLIG